MAYDVSDVELFQWGPDSTFGSASVTHFIVGPRGKVGFVRDIMVDITTSLVGTTAVPEIDVGFSVGDSTFGRYRLGTATGTGYAVGAYRASNELITGNPPRALADYTGHVILDGGPLTSSGIAGGSFGTVVPKGRIPASGWTITSVVQGVDSSHCRIFAVGVNPGSPFKDLVVGQLVNVQGISGGGTNANANVQAITAIDTVSSQYFEVAQTFTGTYTSGGNVWLPIAVLCAKGAGGSTAGGGFVRLKVQWLGSEEV
jgi:hypothetical protein